MKHSTVKQFFAIGIGALACQAFAQTTLNLTGKVTGSDGVGLAGVTVSLARSSNTTTTGADGTYSLTGTASLIRLDGKGPNGLAFDNRTLSFNVLAENTDVRVELFNMVGKSLAILANGKYGKGNYRINPFVAGAQSHLSFLSIRIGKDNYTLKLFGEGSKPMLEPAMDRSDLPKSALMKSAAATLDTLIVTKAGYSTGKKMLTSYAGAHDFIIVKPEVFWGDPASYPVAKNVMTYVMLNRTNGKYTDDQIYWSFGNQTQTIAQSHIIDMPANASGRVNFHLESATGKYTDFIEHTISATVWNGNTTRVDGYGLPIAIRLICGDGTDEMLGEEYEVFYMGRDNFFKAYKDAVPAEFAHTADNGAPYRIIAPGKGDGGFGVGQQYGTYFDAYLKDLGITGATTNDAFACAGKPFGSDAQLAGAVNRHVAQLPKTEWTKPENFYLQSPANWYAKFIHDVSFQHKAYGFAYDDAAGFAAYTSCSKPKTLIIAVGF